MKKFSCKVLMLLLAAALACGTMACKPVETGGTSSAPAGLEDDEFEDIGNANDDNSAASVSGGASQGAGSRAGATSGTSSKEVNLNTDPTLKPKSITLKDKKIRIIGIDQEQFRKDGSAAKYFAEHYGGTVEQIVTNVGEWFTKLISMQLANKPVDLVSATSGGFPDVIPQNVLQTVDNIIDINHPVMKDLKGAHEKYSYKGNHYLVPWLETPTDFVFYNKKMIKDAGLTDPYELSKQGKWDWDAYKKYATDLSVRSGNTTTVWGLSLINHHQAYLVDSTGKSTVKLDSSNHFASNLRDADIKRGINFINDLVNVAKLAEVTDSTARLDDGRCAMQQAPYFFNESYPKLKKAKNLGFAPLPKDPNNSQYVQSGGALGYFVSAGKVNKEGIEAFIQSAVISERLKGLPNAQEYKDSIKEQMKKYPMYTEQEIIADSNRFKAIWDLPKFYSPVNYVPAQKLYWEVVRDKKPYDTVVEALEPELLGKIKDLNTFVK